MKAMATRFAALLVAASLLAAGPVMAQQPATVPEKAPATTTHNDPIVQKRMEVRKANQAHRANRAEAKQSFRNEVRQSKAERNAAVQESRARAQEALNKAN